MKETTKYWLTLVLLIVLTLIPRYFLITDTFEVIEENTFVTKCKGVDNAYDADCREYFNLNIKK